MRNAFFLAVLLLAATRAVAADTGGPIARAELFRPDFTAHVSLSPDGTQLAFVRPVNGIPQVWVALLGDLAAASPVTTEKRAGLSTYQWTRDGKRIVFLRDLDGGEQSQLFVVDIAARTTRDLTGNRLVQTELVKMSGKHPGVVLAAYNDRDRRYRDVYRVDLETGKRTRVFENRDRYSSFIADSDLRIRLALRVEPDGSTSYFRLDDGKPVPLTSMPLGDLRSSKILQLDDAGRLWMYDSRGGDKANLVTLDIMTGAVTHLADAEQADIIGMLADPAGNVLATREDPLVSTWKVRSPSVQADFDALATATSSPFDIVDKTPDGQSWLVYEAASDRPGRYGLWQRESRRLVPLFVTRPGLADRVLPKTFPVKIRSRDGLELPSYLTLPAGVPDGESERPAARLPLVLDVHGGPWLRDRYEYNPKHLWLASRGYAVLSVNFRSSAGFGRNFIVAGDRQWTGTMHDDLIDAVDWAIARGVADPDRVAIYGLSYGGYSALVSLTFPPRRFACAVDIAGPSDLAPLIADMPDWWQWQRPQFANRVGDPRNPADALDMRLRSPLTFVDRVERPLLVGHGINDPRVPISQSERFVAALQARKGKVTFVAYPDEGHVFAKTATKVSFHAVAEHFLGACLGGQVEPYGTDLQESHLQLRAGAEHVPGLRDALRRK